MNTADVDVLSETSLWAIALGEKINTAVATTIINAMMGVVERRAVRTAEVLSVRS